MEYICEWLCENTQLILKKNVPEYCEEDFPELQAASRAVEEGGGEDKMETILRIFSNRPDNNIHLKLKEEREVEDKKE